MASAKKRRSLSAHAHEIVKQCISSDSNCDGPLALKMSVGESYLQDGLCKSESEESFPSATPAHDIRHRDQDVTSISCEDDH